jgi:hypothetical protein
MDIDPRNPVTIRPLIVAVIGLAGTIFFGVVLPVWLVSSFGDLTWAQYRAELIGASLTIATGLLLTVVVAMLVEGHRQRSVRQASDRELRRAVIAQLRNVHDQVKAAALLIKAHRSARTYGEQMRRLIEVRVHLLDARRTVVAEPRSFEGEDKVLISLIDAAAGYLANLTTEYEGQYLRVSKVQLFSHEWDVAQARKAATSDKPPKPEEMQASTVAWAELTGKGFPRLRILCESSTEAADTHEREFSKPLGRAIDMLHAQNARHL